MASPASTHGGEKYVDEGGLERKNGDDPQIRSAPPPATTCPRSLLLNLREGNRRRSLVDGER